MNFDFSDDQKLLKDQARKFLAEKCPTKVPRGVLEARGEYDKGLWKAVADMGWCGTSIPEAYGGLGLGYLELCVIAEELGRALAPVPFSSTVYLFAEALMLAGSEDQKKNLLPKVATGAIVGALASAEGPKPVTPKAVKATFKTGKLDGEKVPVVDGASADHAVVLARVSDEPGERGLGLVLVDLKGAGVTRESVATLDPSRGTARLSFKGAAAELLGRSGEGWSHFNRVLDRAAVLTAFEQLGGADACLAMAREFALGRYAFGRPIGSFQAIKHKLADIYVGNELARSNAYYGAWALSTGAAELALAAASARVSATQAFDFAAKENIQTHGGMGFTWEADCHLFYRRARLLALSLGAERAWKEKLVTELELRNAA